VYVGGPSPTQLLLSCLIFQACCPALRNDLFRTSPRRAARPEPVRSEARIHPVWWPPPIWCFLFIWWMVGGEINQSTCNHFKLFLSRRDKDCGFQLYQSDPSGNYAGWTVTNATQIDGFCRMCSDFSAFCLYVLLPKFEVWHPGNWLLPLAPIVRLRSHY